METKYLSTQVFCREDNRVLSVWVSNEKSVYVHGCFFLCLSVC
jgi:hypothetical protein